MKIMAACCCYFHGIYSLQRDERSIIIYSTKKVLHILFYIKNIIYAMRGIGMWYWNII